MPPERTPRTAASAAGALRFAAPAQAGACQVTTALAAWIDVVRDGRSVRPTGVSGAAGCAGVRFELQPRPFDIQVSDTAATTAALLVEPVQP